MKKLTTVVAILIVIGLFGCVTHAKEIVSHTTSPNKTVFYNDRELYYKLKAKFENQNKIKIVYNMGLYSDYYSVIFGSIKYIKLNKDSHEYYTLSHPMLVFGGVGLYNLNGTQLACELTSGAHEQTICKFGTSIYEHTSIWEKFYPYINNKTNISLVEVKNVDGRSCYDFKMNYGEIDLQELFGRDFGHNKYPNTTLEICIDNETGAPLLIKLMSKDGKKIIEANITKISLNVTERDLQIPSNYIILKENSTVITEKIILPLSSENFITNGDFSNGLNGWKINGNKDNIKLINDGDHLNVTEFNISVGCDSIYLSKNLDVDVKYGTEMNLVMSFKIDDNYCNDISNDTLNVTGKCNDNFPLQVSIYYIGTDNQTHIWSWGFATKELKNKSNYSVVRCREWYYFISGNLMGLNPKPIKIIKIVVGGSGRDFTSEVDNVQLLGILY